MTSLFIAEPAGVWQRRLRVYARVDDPCSARTDGGAYHAATVAIEDTTIDPTGPDGYVSISTNTGGITADDPRWPKVCDCGYSFALEDLRQRQVWHDDVFRAPDGSQFTDRDPPVGAMWRAKWIPDRDGIESYIVQLPLGGSWITTQQSMKGEYWDVTGTAPKITVTPSIFCSPSATPPGWHGWIRDGELVDA